MKFITTSIVSLALVIPVFAIAGNNSPREAAPSKPSQPSPGSARNKVHEETGAKLGNLKNDVKKNGK
jgi:hypothetical protein